MLEQTPSSFLVGSGDGIPTCPALAKWSRCLSPRPDGVVGDLVRLEGGLDWISVMEQRFGDHIVVDLHFISVSLAAKERLTPIIAIVTIILLSFALALSNPRRRSITLLIPFLNSCFPLSLCHASASLITVTHITHVIVRRRWVEQCKLPALLIHLKLRILKHSLKPRILHNPSSFTSNFGPHSLLQSS